MLGLLSAPFLLGGGGGSKRPAPLFPGPQGGPAHGLHPRFVVAEIWADKGQGGGGAYKDRARPPRRELAFRTGLTRVWPGLNTRVTSVRLDLHRRFTVRMQ